RPAGKDLRRPRRRRRVAAVPHRAPRGPHAAGCPAGAARTESALMAERTEKATPKRRTEARAKGQVARSQDLTSAAGLPARLAARAGGGPPPRARLGATISGGLARSGDTRLVSPTGLGSLLAWSVGSFAAAVAPVVIAAAVGGLIANVVQVRLHFS